jgi:hypothetical protein
MEKMLIHYHAFLLGHNNIPSSFDMVTNTLKMTLKGHKNHYNIKLLRGYGVAII